MPTDHSPVPLMAAAVDDALAELALAALELPPGTALLQGRDGARQVLALGGHDVTALTDARCPAGTEALAVCFECAAIRLGGRTGQGVIALAVHRSRRSATRLLHLPDGNIEPVDAVGGPLYDAVLQALGAPRRAAALPYADRS